MREYHPQPLTPKELERQDEVHESMRTLFWNLPETDEFPLPISSELGDVIFTPKMNVVQSQKEEGIV